MRSQDYFRDKKVCIVGLARSGFACANLLNSLGARVSVTDNGESGLIRPHAAELRKKGVDVEIGRHSEGFIRGKDIVVISPGIPESALPVRWAKRFKVPLVSEIEIAGLLCPATIIAVTGTNGKTTVTTLIGRVLAALGKKVFVCGNIGNPLSGELDKIGEGDFVCLEVSSFQLERIEAFKPKVAVILNLSRNHLDRYEGMPAYLEAKKRIFMNQDETDYLVLNSQDPVISGLAKEAQSKIVYFLEREGLNPNQAAVLAATSVLGAGEELCLKIFREFKGVEHRLEFVLDTNRVKFINDSKSTTVDSAIWALKNTEGPLILILGGREKGNDYNPVLALVKEKVRGVVLIGEAKEKIRHAFGGLFWIEEASTLEEAVQRAFLLAKPGYSVLLSPMCKSFDMFSDYEERGRVFKQAVHNLALSRKAEL